MLEIPKFDDDGEDHSEQVDWINATVEKLYTRTLEINRAARGLEAFERVSGVTDTTKALSRELNAKRQAHSSDVLVLIRHVVGDTSPFADLTMLELVKNLMHGL